MKKTEAIKLFLAKYSKIDLYNPEMECQVLVEQGEGRRFEAEFRGRRYWGYELNGVRWKNFRIPFSDLTYKDTELTFSLEEHALAIGLTGWNWKQKHSCWVGFDFDSLIGHQKGLSEAQLQQVIDTCSQVPWVEVRRSRGGCGVHLYVFLDPPIKTENRKEHSALARAILSQLVTITGVDLQAQVDVLGQNLWIWHKHTAENGLELISKGEPLNHVPANWKDHLPVVKGEKPKPSSIEGLDELVSKQKRVVLDNEHRRLLGWFTARGNKSLWWWDMDRHMLVCHTVDLAQAHQELKLRGVFKTIATGKDLPDQNCFAFPHSHGSWVVRRHGRNVQEHSMWEKDGGGWTWCPFNRPLDLTLACKAHEGVEASKGGFVFRLAEQALATLKDLQVQLSLPSDYCKRAAEILPHKEKGKLIVRVKREPTDSHLKGWLATKRGDYWEIVKQYDVVQEEIEAPDDMIRHGVVNGVGSGWFVLSRDAWIAEPANNVSHVLVALGVPKKDVTAVMGQAILNHWELVSLPFQDEYPGHRKWNRNAAKLAFKPKEGNHPTWTAMLAHCGHGLNEAVIQTKWCQEWGLKTGGDYLLLWIASMFQEPLEPLPYLFFWSKEENTGKSTFHESLSLLFTKGYVKADTALTSQGRFNQELEGAVLCVTEEVNLNQSKTALQRIKDWVTSPTISIHEKGCTPRDMPNSTHWVQCANNRNFCPIFPGDSRIVVTYVHPPLVEVPKRELRSMLVAEAQAFLYTVLNLELPEPKGRLRIPVLETIEKKAIQEANKSELEQFIDECLHRIPGALISFAEFYELFNTWLPSERRKWWSKRRISNELPHDIPRGRAGAGGQIHLGNLCLKRQSPSKAYYRDEQGRLVK